MTGYTLALATVMPITEWEANRFSTKRLFMGSLAALKLRSLLYEVKPKNTLYHKISRLSGYWR
ncbi:hypothetical protein [Mycobacterium leprae]|uniref:hypothetical protein n=1 Tax=Mycobacterium leprae TaxID=1769 RepID=UPI00031D110D|nr:hypothetical protein [Mycobacterium leprae]